MYPGLTSPRALRSRVLQVSEYFWRRLRALPNFILKISSEYFLDRIEAVRCSCPECCLLLYGVRLNSHSIWSSPRALGWLEESCWGSIQSWVFYLYLTADLKNKILMTRAPQPPSLKSKSLRFGIKDPMNRGMQYMTVEIWWLRWPSWLSNSNTTLFGKHSLKNS
jgi:hypothetical protein